VVQSTSIETTLEMTPTTTSSQSSNTINLGGTTATIDSNVFRFPNASEVENRFTIQDAFPGLKFKRPLGLQNTGDGSGRVFVVEQDGRIYVIENKPIFKRTNKF